MRLHRHQMGRAELWHSVRTRHDEVWIWCAHQQEIECHHQQRRRHSGPFRVRKEWKLQAAHGAAAGR